MAISNYLPLLHAIGSAAEPDLNVIASSTSGLLADCHFDDTWCSGPTAGTRMPTTRPAFKRMHGPDTFTHAPVRAWLLRLRAVFDFAPAHLPAADPVLHMSAPVRRGAVADARLGLA